MRLLPADLSSSNWVATVPGGLGASVGSTFNATEFLSKVIASIN